VSPIAFSMRAYQPCRLSSLLKAARRSGRGLFQQEWRIEGCRPDLAEHAAATITDWCRTTLASCRRPWGVNRFDLSVAWYAPAGSGGDVAVFSRLDPACLYGEDGMEDRLRDRLLERCRLEDGGRIAAALFSWGDALHATLPAN